MLAACSISERIMLIDPLKQIMTFWRTKWSTIKYYPICDECAAGGEQQCQNPECVYYGGAAPSKMSFLEYGVDLSTIDQIKNEEWNGQIGWRMADKEPPPPGNYWVCCEEHLGNCFIGEGHFNGEIWVHPERYGFSGGSWFQVKYWTYLPEPPED